MQVISICTKLAIKKAKQACDEYKAYIEAADKLELLEEMVDYNQYWDSVDTPDLHMIIKGMILFGVLKNRCETSELKDSVTFYYNLLEMELNNYERNFESRVSDNGICDKAQ